MKLFKNRLKAGIVILFGVLCFGFYKIFVPHGMPNGKTYFESIPERKLQSDEQGQLIRVRNEYNRQANRGDDFLGWNTEIQDFWKYTIAFSAYGIPSAMMIDPDNADEYKLLLDNMIWKMKSKKVWSDFVDRGFGVDPISHQNIMYKGHLNLMYGLYQLTTGDDRYAREFTWLTQQMVDEMRLHHAGQYEGVTCEPNAWFVECNVIGIMSLHIYDKLYGTNYTENEIEWTVDFIMDRMRDPDTGLFYRSYHPHHDVVFKDVSGYANAWTLMFLNYFRPEAASLVYESGFKSELLLEFPVFYASVAGDARSDPSYNQIATIFGLWAAKEFGDVQTFSRIRNSIDKFGGLKPAEEGGLRYDSKDSVHFNGVVLGAKLHAGWKKILDHDWGHEGHYKIPDTGDMSWGDLLPSQIFSSQISSSQSPSMTAWDPEKQDCPNCYWGDYESVRMKELKKVCSAEAVNSMPNSCGVNKLGSVQFR